jgi:hypothetical protein
LEGGVSPELVLDSQVPLVGNGGLYVGIPHANRCITKAGEVRNSWTVVVR